MIGSRVCWSRILWVIAAFGTILITSPNAVATGQCVGQYPVVDPGDQIGGGCDENFAIPGGGVGGFNPADHACQADTFMRLWFDLDVSSFTLNQWDAQWEFLHLYADNGGLLLRMVVEAAALPGHYALNLLWDDPHSGESVVAIATSTLKMGQNYRLIIDYSRTEAAIPSGLSVSIDRQANQSDRILRWDHPMDVKSLLPAEFYWGVLRQTNGISAQLFMKEIYYLSDHACIGLGPP